MYEIKNWTNTVKAPNFDRVFMKNIFFLHIFAGWPPWKKSTERVKSRPLKVHKNENFFGFDFEFCTISLLVMSKY
jgi:hypothetical protein